MKICWDNLEKLQFTRKGNWKINGRGSTYYEKVCKNCNEIFLGQKKDNFCSITCGNSNRIFTNQTREKISKSLTGKKNLLLYKCGKEMCWFDTYASKIEFAEEVRRSLDNPNILEVKCKYCGKWFKPTQVQILNRIRFLINDRFCESLFYCSNECKKACPIFNQRKYPKGFDEGSSREVQPELRKLVLERDNYTCQNCYLSSIEHCVELHCHHIDPVKLNPIESADIDNCITLCKDCHLEAHQKDGCKTGQLANC